MTASPRIALLGCGRWGKEILRNLVALGCDVVVVDPSPDGRAIARTGGAIEILAEARELAGVEGIVIATPTSRHVACIDSVLHRGVPIFCEKPLCLDLNDSRRLATTAGDRLFEMHVWRYHPGIEKMRALLQAGDLGDPVWLRSSRLGWTSPRRDVDPIWTLAPHDLSIALEILGEMPRPKSAVAETRDGLPVSMVGMMDGPTPFVFDVSTRHVEKRREVRLHGTAATVALNGERLILVRGSDERTARELPIDTTEEPLRRELGCFLAYLRGGPAPRSSMVDSGAVLSALTQLREMAGLDR